MAKYRSETFRGGEPPSHIECSEFIYYTVRYYFEETPFRLKIKQYADWNEKFDNYFIKLHKLDALRSTRTYYAHEYDRIIGAYVNVMEDGKEKWTFRIFRFIEIGDIGDDTKHQPDHEEQMINDGIAKSWVEYKHPWALYIKVNKDDAYDREWLIKRLKLNTIFS